MQKWSRLQTLSVFLLTAAITFAVLLIASSPATDNTSATLAITDTPAPAPNPTNTPAPTPFVLASQCASTGEAYTLQTITQDASPQPSSTNTYPSPDGRYILYREGGHVFVKGGDIAPRDLINDENYSDLNGRVYWSLDSRHVLLMPDNNNQATIFNPDDGSAVVLSGLENPYDFRGWSPHNKFVMFGSGDYRTVSLWSAETGEIVYRSSYLMTNYNWSPDDRWFAYTWDDDSSLHTPPLHGLSIVSSDGLTENRTMIFAANATYNYAEKMSSKLLWSPDSRYLALSYYLYADQIYRRLLLLDTNATVLPGLTVPISIGEPIDPNNPQISDDPLAEALHWSDDSQRFSYLRRVGYEQFELVTFSPASGHSTALATSLHKPPFYSPAGDQMGLYTRLNDLYAIHLTDLNGEKPITLVENATDAGNPDWSPDGKWVAAVWAEGEKATRKIHLRWMHPGGSERHDVTANFKDVRELRWLNDGKTLAYIAWRGTAGNSIETVNLETGERTVLAEKLDTVTDPIYDSKTDTLEFWWKTDADTFGKDAFHADGTSIYHFVAAGEFERPREEFWSPDGKILALKLDVVPYSGLNDRQLVLTYADGREPVMARVGLSGLDTPVWSPDSRELAFVQWARGDGTYAGPNGLAVISADGETLWYGEITLPVPPLDWAKCGA